MSLLSDLVGGVSRLTKSLNLLEERFNQQAKENQQTREELKELRKENAALVQRVTTLEADRKTAAAEVEAALTRTVSAFQLEAANRRIQQMEAELGRRPQLPSSDAG